MHNRGIQTGLHALVQECRVQYLPGGGVQAERDVRDTQGEVERRMRRLQPANRLDRLDAVAAHLLLTGGDGERQGIDDDVLFGQPPVRRQIGDQPLGDGDLVVGGARLPLLVDGQRDDGGAVLHDEFHDPLIPGAGPVPVFEVHRVDGTASAERFESGADHLRLGRVDHHWQRRRCREPRREGRHVQRSVTPDIVDVEVEHVCAVSGLLLGDVEAVLVVLRDHRVAEAFGAVGIGPLPDHQEAGVLVERHRRVQRGGGRFMLRVPRRARHLRDGLGDLPDVFGRGSAAAADHRQSIVGDEAGQRDGQLGRGQRVLRPVWAENRQPRVGHHRDRDARVPGEIAQVFTHLGGTGCAVQPDDVDTQRLEGGECRTDFRSQQHGAGGLHGDVHQDGEMAAPVGHRPPRSDDGGLDLKQILRGFDEDAVGAAVEHPDGALLIGAAQLGESGVPQAGQFGTGPHRPDHEALRAVGRTPHLIGDAPRDRRSPVGQIGDAVGDVVVAEI